MAYNGHKNWSQWNQSLWVNNDEGLYRRAAELCRRYNKDRAARILRSELPERTPDGARWSVTGIRNAMIEL